MSRMTLCFLLFAICGCKMETGYESSMSMKAADFAPGDYRNIQNQKFEVEISLKKKW